MNPVLLDTQALVWLVEGNRRLGQRARRLCEQGLVGDALRASSISYWELAVQMRKNRIKLTTSLAPWRQGALRVGIQEIPVSAEIGMLAGGFELETPDPADRFILATAIISGATLVTSDSKLLATRAPATLLDAQS